MDGNLSTQVARCIDVHQRKRRGRQALTVLGAIVVFCTVYALMMPAVTMSNQVICGMEAHVHSEDCWTVELSGPRPELVCDAMDYRGVVIHQHNSFCCDEYGELICTLPEVELHVHSEECYREHRELICQDHQEVGHVHGPSCWAYEKGELICTQAEAGDAHTHTDACYQTQSRQMLTCSIPEAEPHTHDDSCYTTRTQQELTCGLSESEDVLDEEGNVVEPGHHHDASCYTESQETELTCSREETEGHRHDESCYTTEEERTLACGLDQAQGHQHGKECYAWTEKLVCTEEEREAGHVHTEECYKITEILACRKQEMAPHTHDEKCYNELGVLVCELPEAIVHDHEAACLHTPEGEMEEIRALTCGMQEHEHTEGCYVELVPKEDDGCLCGKPAHLHSAGCYFEDGTLLCTMEEHVHTLACMQEAPPDDPEPEESTGLWLAEDYTYENEEFRLTFHINGFASFAEEGEDGFLPGGQEAPEEPVIPEAPEIPETPVAPEEPEVPEKPETPEKPAVPEKKPETPKKPETTQKPAAPEKPEAVEKPAVTEKPETPEEIVIPETPEVVEPIAPPVVVVPETPEPVEQTPPTVVIPEPEPEPEDWGISTSTSTFFSLPRIGVSGLADGPYAVDADADGGEMDYWADRYVPIGEDQGGSVELNPEDVVFSLEFHSEGDEAYDSLAARAEELSEDEMLFLQVMTLTAELGGRALDLSDCTVEVEVTLSEQMLAQLAAFSESRPLGVSEGGEGAVDGDEGIEPVEPTLTLKAFGQEEDGEVTELASVKLSEAASGPAAALTDAPARAPMRAPARAPENNASETESTMSYTTRGGQPTALSLLMNVYPVFTVEYYAWIKEAALGEPVASDNKNPKALSFIDTSADKNNGTAKLPVNGVTPETKWLQLNGDGTIHFADPELKQIYKDKEFQFNPNKEELTVEKMFGMMENAHYDVAALWELKEGVKPEEAQESDWKVFSVEQYGANLEKLSFTNNVEVDGKQIQNPKNPTDPTDLLTLIAIRQGSVFRLVYNQRVDENVLNDESVFYDYDITDGTRSGSNPITVNTKQQGINSPANYPEGTTDAKFGFGNSNTGTGLENQTWNNNKINQANKVPGEDGKKKDVGYSGCTFGLVQGFAGGTVLYSNGVTGPNLFGGTAASGKTCYEDYSLKFIQEGDTHTLSAVMKGGSVVLGELEKFGHPAPQHTHIWTNGVRNGAVGFWPLDGLNREGADPEFGATNGGVKYGTGNWDNMPVSDNGLDHNAYFGMNYSVQFELSEEYVGPLEYYFYGDDDMWVFLGNQLVCDIGGVHSSVGQYVDLWDYIEGGRENHEKGTYTLTVFFTERGASGSTCWMQYTLPNAIAVPVIKAPNLDYTPLIIQKVVDGNLATEELKETFYTFDLTLTNTFENYSASVFDENGTAVPEKLEDGKLVYDQEGGSTSFTITGGKKIVFELRDGWKLKVSDLSPYAGYDVNEVFPDDTPPEGCSTSVQVTKGSSVGPAQAGTNASDPSMGVASTTVTFTNMFEYELPETGGSGTTLYTLAGGLLIVAALWLWYRKKIAEGRGADVV